MGRVRGEGGGGEASDGGQDLVCRFCSAEGFWLLVMGSDKLPGRDFQFLNASVRATLNLPLCE